jgi:hypothetical protein
MRKVLRRNQRSFILGSSWREPGVCFSGSYVRAMCRRVHAPLRPFSLPNASAVTLPHQVGPWIRHEKIVSRLADDGRARGGLQRGQGRTEADRRRAGRTAVEGGSDGGHVVFGFAPAPRPSHRGEKKPLRSAPEGQSRWKRSGPSRRVDNDGDDSSYDHGNVGEARGSRVDAEVHERAVKKASRAHGVKCQTRSQAGPTRRR